MIQNLRLIVVALGLVVGMASQLFCAREESKALPEVPVRLTSAGAAAPSYRLDIQPIFDQQCISCHGTRVAENGLRLDSYQGAMQGTRYGAVVVPGKSAFSTMVFVLEGKASKEISMPHGGDRISPNRIESIRLWIDAGAQDN